MSAEQVTVRPAHLTAAKRLTYLVRWSDEDELYLATAAAIPGSTIHGETEEAVLAKAVEVAALWLAAYEVWGKPAPAPCRHLSER